MSEFIVQRRKKVVKIDPEIFSEEVDEEIRAAEELADKILNEANREIIPPVIAAKKTTQKRSTKKKTTENVEIHLEHLTITSEEFITELKKSKTQFSTWVFRTNPNIRTGPINEILTIVTTLLSQKMKELRRD